MMGTVMTVYAISTNMSWSHSSFSLEKGSTIHCRFCCSVIFSVR